MHPVCRGRNHADPAAGFECAPHTVHTDDPLSPYGHRARRPRRTRRAPCRTRPAGRRMTPLRDTVAALRHTVGSPRPRVLLVLGSGLGGLADAFEDAVATPFADVPGFAAAAIAGHRGQVVAGTLEGVRCIALQGRYHLYEGHDPAAAAL